MTVIFAAPDTVTATTVGGYLRAYTAQRVVTPTGATVSPSPRLAWVAWKMRDCVLGRYPLAAKSADSWRLVG